MELFEVKPGDRITVGSLLFYVVNLTRPKAPDTVWTISLEPVRE